MDEKTEVTQALTATVMLWSDVSYHDIEEIDKMQSIPELESALSSMLEGYLPEPRREVLLDMLVQTVLFCRECNFKKEQTSALLSILKSIHEVNIETPLNNIDQSAKYCKELLLCHSVRRPPFSINLFSVEEVECILKYINNSYLRHYKLYKYIFTPQMKLDISLTYSGTGDQDEPTVEEPSVLEPLEPDVENVLEKETEAPLNTDRSPQTHEVSIEEPERATIGLNVEVKAMIEKVVKEQMVLVSEHIDRRIKEIVVQQINVPDPPPPPKHKSKK